MYQIYIILPFNRLTLKKGQKLSKSVKMLLNVT